MEKPGEVEYEVTVKVRLKAQSAEQAVNAVREVIYLAECGHELGGFEYKTVGAERADLG